MLCSLCFRQKPNCIFFINQGVQLSCNHNVCLSCMPKRRSGQNFIQYQCQTCLTNHEIDLSQKSKVQRSRTRENLKTETYNVENLIESPCIFCWNCHQAITINDYIKGRHREHEVQTYEEAIPSIKNLMLQQLQKSLSIKEYLSENKQMLQKNRLKQNYQELIDRINQFFQKQIEIIEKKREKLMVELESFYSSGLRQVERQIDFLVPFIEEIECLETKISHFITDQIPITEINPISGVLEIIEEYSQNVKETKFLVPDFPQFIAKSSVKESIQNSCQLFINKPLTSNYLLNKVSIKKPSVKEEFFGSDKFVELKKGSKTHSRMKTSEGLDQTFDRKVRLVQKIKGKMKYTSLCSTAFS